MTTALSSKLSELQKLRAFALQKRCILFQLEMDEVDREHNTETLCLLNKRKMEKEQYFILTEVVK